MPKTTYRIMGELTMTDPHIWVEEEDVPTKDCCYAKGIVEFDGGFTNKDDAEHRAKAYRFAAIKDNGLEITYDRKTKMWEATSGGKLIIACGDACYTCEYVQFCDEHEGSCSVLS